NYHKDTNLLGELSDISNPKQLEEELCKYFTVCCKTNGDEYSVASLQSAINALNRYFNDETSKLKPIDLNDKKAHPDLWCTLNGKIKTLSSSGFGESNGSDALTIDEVQQILSYSQTSRLNPQGLLNRVFFFNALCLGLRGGEHFLLELFSFKKKDSGGYEVKLYRSKTNQRSLESPGVAETFSIPPIFDIAFFKRLVISCDIDISGRKITNQTGRKTLIQILKALGLSDYETMSISCHKSLKGLASYERLINHVQELEYKALDKVINYEKSQSHNKLTQMNLSQNESIEEFKQLLSGATFINSS
ncbi:16371_t:CDS:2, partial [Cetraspora pellucida]